MRIQLMTTIAAVLCLLAAGPPLLGQEAPAEWQTQVELGLGYQHLDVDGNLFRYLQYGTPPTGTFLDDLRLAAEVPKETLVLLQAETPTETDKSASVSIYGLQSPFAELRWGFSDFRFHPFFNPAAAERRTHTALLRLGIRPGWPEINLSVDDTTLLRDAVADYPSFGVSDLAARVPFRIGSTAWRAGGSWGRFTDLTNTQPDWLYRGASLSGALTAGRRLLVGADLARLSAHAETLGRGGTFSGGSLDASYLVSSALSLRGLYRFHNRSTPLTENGYSSQIQTAAVEASYAPAPKISLRIGAETRRIEHLSTFQTRLDTPKQDTWWTHLRMRPSRAVDVRGRYRSRKLFDQPAPGLYPRDLTEAEASVQFTPWSNGGFGASWSRARRENPFLGLDYALNITHLSAWWVPTPKLTLSADYSLQNWESNTPFPAGWPADRTPFTAWLTDGRIVGVSAGYFLGPRTSLDASYHRATGRGEAMSTAERSLFVRLRRSLAPGWEGLVGYEQVRFDDDLAPENRYSTGRVRVGLVTRM